jgi:hypothetical protein
VTARQESNREGADEEIFARFFARIIGRDAYIGRNYHTPR